MRIRPTHLLALAGLAMAAGTAQAQDRRPLTALDLYHIKNAGSVVLSPDGRRAVFVVTEVDSAENRYRRDLWIANTDGSGARRLTWTNARGIGTPSFSPDGRMLAFTQSRQGQGNRGQGAQVWILPLAEGGEAWPLTEMETGAFGPVWSPDGRRIAFLSELTPQQLANADTTRPRVDAGAIANIHRDRAAALASIRAKLAANARTQDPRLVTRLSYLGETSIEDETYGQIYVVDVRPGARPLQVTKLAYDLGVPAWTPAGDSLVFSAASPRGEYHPDYELESDLRVVAADGAGQPRIIPQPGYAEGSPAFSRDGQWIVYTRSHADPDSLSATDAELMMMRRDGSDRRSITAALGRAPSGYILTPDGWLYFTVSSEGAVPLYRTRLDTVDPRPVVQGPRGVLSFDAAGGRIAWSEMNPRIPSDVYTADAAGAGERRLTTLNDSLLATVYVSDYHEIRYPSFDGRQAHGWYLLPIDYRAGRRPPPLAVQMHGGPHAMWGPGEATMWLEYQMLAGAGYTVFFSNPRGSSGYGNEGLRAIQRNWGSPPAQDILIGADSVIARGVADRNRQVVTGGSYAGYMTTWLIAREAPTRFKAAVSARGVYDLATWYGGSNTWRLFEGEFGLRPWEDPQITREQSPITYVANIQTPLLLLHADTDFRATIAGAEAMYRAMKVLGKEVEFVRYPREGHELTRSGEPAHRIDHMLRTLEFFERYITH